MKVNNIDGIFDNYLKWTSFFDDIIKWKHSPLYWPFVWAVHRWPVKSPYKGQWRRALVFSLLCDWINGWVNNGEAGDLRRHRAHYDVTVMYFQWGILHVIVSVLNNNISFNSLYMGMQFFVIYFVICLPVFSLKGAPNIHRHQLSSTSDI